jgi:hypothetical protein
MRRGKGTEGLSLEERTPRYVPEVHASWVNWNPVTLKYFKMIFVEWMRQTSIKV